MADLTVVEIQTLPENFIINPDHDYFVIQKTLDSETYKLKLAELASAVQSITDAPQDGGYYIRRDGQWVKDIDYGGY
jgi:hypothetical protein